MRGSSVCSRTTRLSPTVDVARRAVTATRRAARTSIFLHRYWSRVAYKAACTRVPSARCVAMQRWQVQPPRINPAAVAGRLLALLPADVANMQAFALCASWGRLAYIDTLGMPRFWLCLAAPPRARAAARHRRRQQRQTPLRAHARQCEQRTAACRAIGAAHITQQAWNSRRKTPARPHPKPPVRHRAAQR